MKQLNDCLTPFNKHKHELYFPEVKGYPLLDMWPHKQWGTASPLIAFMMCDKMPLLGLQLQAVQ